MIMVWYDKDYYFRLLWLHFHEIIFLYPHKISNYIYYVFRLRDSDTLLKINKGELPICINHFIRFSSIAFSNKYLKSLYSVIRW